MGERASQKRDGVACWCAVEDSSGGGMGVRSDAKRQMTDWRWRGCVSQGNQIVGCDSTMVGVFYN